MQGYSERPLNLLHDDFVVDCYTSWMILPPVVLMFQDSLGLYPDYSEMDLESVLLSEHSRSTRFTH